jgi:hypothetical protein
MKVRDIIALLEECTRGGKYVCEAAIDNIVIHTDRGPLTGAKFGYSWKLWLLRIPSVL